MSLLSTRTAAALDAMSCDVNLADIPQIKTCRCCDGGTLGMWDLIKNAIPVEIGTIDASEQLLPFPGMQKSRDPGEKHIALRNKRRCAKCNRRLRCGRHGLWVMAAMWHCAHCPKPACLGASSELNYGGKSISFFRLVHGCFKTIWCIEETFIWENFFLETFIT